MLLAIKESKLPLVEKMLTMGADINAMTNDKMNALHVASKWGNEDIVKFLIERKPNFLNKATEVEWGNISYHNL